MTEDWTWTFYFARLATYMYNGIGLNKKNETAWPIWRQRRKIMREKYKLDGQLGHNLKYFLFHVYKRC